MAQALKYLSESISSLGLQPNTYYSAIRYIYWRFQIVFKRVLGIRTFLAFSLQRGVTLWVALELNFLCFIGILRKRVKLSASNSVIYYFLIQSLGRVIIFIRILIVIIGHSKLVELTFFLALILKLGGTPFQFWYLKIIQKLSWGLIWVLSIWQKLIPLILLSINSIKPLVFLFGTLSVVLGRVGRVKQKKIKKILGLSSIFSLGWVIISILSNSYIWVKFISGYALALISLVFLIDSINLVNSRGTAKRLKPYFLVMFFTRLLILRGVPPFIGFFLKIIILKFLVSVNFLLVLRLLIISLGLIFVYLITGFYLLTALKVSSLVAKGVTQKFIFLDLIIFNVLIRVIFINIIYCKYYISNNKLQ